MKILCALCLLCSSMAAHSQEPKILLPESPVAAVGIKPYSLSITTNEKYSFLKDSYTNSIGVNVEKRFLHTAFRFGVGYNYVIQTKDNSLVVSANYKLLNWGK